MSDRIHRANDEARILSAIKEAINLDAMDETELAVQLLTPLSAEFPEEPTLHIYLAWYLRLLERYGEAIHHAQYAVQLSPRSSKASLALLHALWDAGNREEAIDEIRRFLPVRRSDKHTPHYVDILKDWEASDRGEGRVRQKLG